MNITYKFSTVFLNIFRLSDKFRIKIGHDLLVSRHCHITIILSLQAIQRMQRHSFIKSRDIFIYSVFCLTTGPKPPLKWFLRIVRSRVSSFKWEYPLLFLRSSTSFLRLLLRLLVTSISPFIFQTNIAERQSKHTLCFQELFFENRAVYEKMWKYFVKNGRPIWQNGACAVHAGYLGLQIHKLRLCNTHCSSTATVMARMGLNVMFHCQTIKFANSSR